MTPIALRRVRSPHKELLKQLKVPQKPHRPKLKKLKLLLRPLNKLLLILTLAQPQLLTKPRKLLLQQKKLLKPQLR